MTIKLTNKEVYYLAMAIEDAMDVLDMSDGAEMMILRDILYKLKEGSKA